MHIPYPIKIAGDYGVIPLLAGGLSIGLSLSLLALERRIQFSKNIFRAPSVPARENIVFTVGFAAGVLLSCLVFPRFLPFMRIAPWGQPLFAWNVIESRFNKT